MERCATAYSRQLAERVLDKLMAKLGQDLLACQRCIPEARSTWRGVTVAIWCLAEMEL